MDLPGHESESKRALEAQLQATLNVIPAYTWYALPSGALTFVNEQTGDYLGLPKEHPLRFGNNSGADWDSHISFLHPDDREESRRIWSACVRTGSPSESSIRVRNAEGGYRWFLTRVEPLRASDGTLLYWIGVNLDIDELKQAQFYLAEGQRLAHMGSWVFEPGGFFAYWSRELFQIYGLDPTQAAPTLEKYLACIHPQDRDSMASLIKRMIAESLGCDATKRILRPNGELRYIRCVGNPIIENGKLQRILGTAIDVTEHELLAEELRRREAYSAKAQALSHTGSFGWNVSTDEHFWSEETFRIFEFAPSSKVSLQMILERVHPQDMPSVKTAIAAASRAEGIDLEHRLLMPDGRVKYLHVVGQAETRETGSVEVIGAVMDVTARKLTEVELRRSKAHLADAQRLSRTGSVGMEGSTKRIFWSEEAARIYGYPPGTEPTTELILQRSHPDDLSLLKDALQRAAQGGSDIDFEHRLLMPDGSIKYLYDLTHYFRDDAGNEELVGAIMDVTERKLAEDAIRRSAAYLAEAQRLSRTGSFGWKPETGEIVWSDETYRIFEYDRSIKPTIDLLTQRVHPEDRSDFLKVIESASAGATHFEHTYRCLQPDGSVKHVHAIAHVTRDKSGRLEYVGAAQDVTRQRLAEDQRKAAADALEASERDLRSIIRTIPTMVWSAAPDGSIDFNFFNPRWFDYTGLSPDQSQDWRWTAAIHPDDLSQLTDAWQSILVSGEPGETEARLRRSDGAYRWFLFRANPLRDESGNIVKWYGIIFDIEDRKRAEQYLRSSEAYLAEAQRLSHTGSWAWNPDNDVRHWSEECYRILGFDPRDGLPRTEEFIQRIHPDDQRAFRESAKRARDNKSDEEVDYRIVHPGGAVKDIHSIGHPVFSASGDLIEYTGTVIDVTERKRAEEELRRSEMELRQMLDLTPQLVAVLGPNRERLYGNRVLLDYYGVSLEEWQQPLGRDKYFHPDDRERIDAFWGRTVGRGSSDELEFRLRKHDGSYRWFLARFNPLRDERGQIRRWYVAGTDIEDRKQAEDRLRSENVALREEIDKASMFEEIVGASPALQAVLSRISKVARSDSTVLITGETGTGKELVARAIHRRSDRASRAFVSVNCAAIPLDLIASELFGHEKGAFTGASQQRLGRFELANGGTLFLDEVGELPAETQIALLRVLQEHEFERVGGTRPIRADVRVIAATNRDLQAAIGAGSFRSDLFYRLHVFPIEIPPLRERSEDIPVLVEYFIDRYARKAGKRITTVEKNTLQVLQSYPWPGNIRELQNVIERSVIVCETENFSVDESWLSRQPLASEPKTRAELPRKLADQEREMIEAALRECGGQVSGPSGAAAKLGLPGSTLESKIRALKINKKLFRAGNRSADRL
jgi:PAS domain S-box-containing protein